MWSCYLSQWPEQATFFFTLQTVQTAGGQESKPMSAVTKDMQYTLRPASAAARVHQVKCFATNGSTFTANRAKVSHIDIPCSPNSFLDAAHSSLSFSVETTKDCAVDYLISSAIRRITLRHGSSVIEDIDSYNLVCCLLSDAQLSAESRKGALSVSQGSAAGASHTVSLDISAGTATATVNATSLSAAATVDSTSLTGTVDTSGSNASAPVTFGGSISSAVTLSGSITSAVALSGTIPATVKPDQPIRDGRSLTATNKVHFTIPLISAFIGSMGGHKMLPLAAMSAGGDLRLEIQWADPLEAFVSAHSDLTYQVSDLCYTARVVELESSVAQQVISAGYQAGNGVLRISSSSYRAYEASVSGTSLATLVPCRFASLTALYSVFRDQSKVGTVNVKSISDRLNIGVKQWYVRSGSENVPATPVSSDESTLMHLMASFGPLANVSHQTCIDATNWAASAGGTFALGLEMSSAANATDIVDSGLNTLNSTTIMHVELNSALATPSIQTTFARFDCALLIDQSGVASVVY